MDEYITPHFKRSEFACKCGCGFDDISTAVVENLELIRNILGKPLVITSGCRCPSHNAEIGGHEHSAHMYGLAADIKVDSDRDRWNIIRFCCFGGVGIGKDFVHLDLVHHVPAIWVY